MRKHNKGFTLIEVLIALVILAIGLLGMSSLMMTSMQSSQSAYLRSQASLLAYDLVERMRANSNQAITSDSYVFSLSSEAPTDPTCASTGCTPSQQAQRDLFQWRAALTGSIPGATMVIARTNPNKYVITIAWSEASALKRGTENLNFVVSADL